MVGEPPHRPDDAAAYLEHERGAEARHERWEGSAYAMVGASWAHNVITANLTAILHRLGRANGCTTVSQDMKVHVPARDGFVYPDIVMVCDPPRFLDDARDVLLNPTLVVEVLSDSTERFDRGEKANGYRALPSVRALLLVSQHRARIECQGREQDGSWRLREYEGDAEAVVPGLAGVVALAEVFAGAWG